MSSVAAIDPELEAGIREAQTRRARDPIGREFVVRTAFALLFVVAAGTLATVASSDRHPSWWLYVVLVGGYGVASRIPFPAGAGEALPTELILVPMLFLLPADKVPLLVAAGLVIASVPDVARGRMSLLRAALWPPANSLFALGPAIVFVVAGEPEATRAGAIVLAAALAAQLLTDLVASSTLERLANKVPIRMVIAPLATTFVIDLMLAPAGLAAAVAARADLLAAFLPLPILVLLARFARERHEYVESILELSTAYRGTALLLGDVVEADDAYTGEHSKQVVELVLAVSDELGLSPRERRLAEFTALLHDVGKIRIPSEVINKPGPLTPAERALINTHSAEGEQLLRRVGGLLAEVGKLVRSCHERWDGGGYPDGLAGNAIPRVARIVSACDAYNAMVTFRPYRRRPLTAAEAAAELRRNRGVQFDPEVVDALLALLTVDVEDFAECPRCGHQSLLDAPTGHGARLCIRCGPVAATPGSGAHIFRRSVTGALAGATGLEPATPGFGDRCSTN